MLGSAVPYDFGYFSTVALGVWLGYFLRKSNRWWLGCLLLMLAPFVAFGVMVIFYDPVAVRNSLQKSN